MGFFERHKALIITSLLFLVLLLTMYNIRISNANDEVREMLIQLNDLKAEEPEPEQQQPEESNKPPAQQRRPNLQTHQAFNQNQEREQEVQSRLQEIFKENAAEQEASEAENSEGSSGNYALQQQKKKEKRKASEGNNTTSETSATESSLRNSSIAFSLIGRSAIEIPNPIYTCDRAGKIVVNITVNAAGEVTSTSINEASSTSTNECLATKAQQYAADARFSKLPGRTSQPGTITYYFQS